MARAARRGEQPLDVRARSTSCSRASPSARATAACSSPAASSRCSRSGARCSTNPKLLIMDEPSEGLAPDDHRDAHRDVPRPRGRGPRDPLRRAEPGDGDRRWPTASSSWWPGRSPPRRRRRAGARPGGAAPLARGGARLMATVVLLGTLDTKGDEYAFVRDRLREAGRRRAARRHRRARRAAGGARRDARGGRARGGRRPRRPRRATPTAARRWTSMGRGAAAVLTRLHGEGRVDGVRGDRRLGQLLDRGARDARPARSACRSSSSRPSRRATPAPTSAPSTSR